MKVVAKPVDMVTWFSKDGSLHPIRFRLQVEDESYKVINVDRIVHKSIEKLAGNDMIVYRCQSEINGVVKPFELKYEIRTCKWMLFKI